MATLTVRILSGGSELEALNELDFLLVVTKHRDPKKKVFFVPGL